MPLSFVPRYHLHVHHNDEIALDDEGLDLVDLARARAEAIMGIRSVLSADVLDGRVSLAGKIVIMDEGSRVLLTVPFSEAVTVSPG